MKVLCIRYGLSLTIGKWYEVLNEDEDVEIWQCYGIINDLGNRNWYRKSWFKTKRELREEKFKQLGL